MTASATDHCPNEIGWSLTCVATGAESCAHLSEDTVRPARTVPMAMFWSTVASYGLGWITICIFLSTANMGGGPLDGDNPAELITRTVPRNYAIAALSLIILSSSIQNIGQLLATSRFIFALARDSAVCCVRSHVRGTRSLCVDLSFIVTFLKLLQTDLKDPSPTASCHFRPRCPHWSLTSTAAHQSQDFVSHSP